MFRVILFRLLFSFLSVCFLITQEAYAAKSYTWDGSTSSNWNTNSNWDDDPGSNGNGVYLVEGPGTYTNPPIISSTPSFTMDDLGISGSTVMTMTGGTVTVNGDFAIAEGSSFSISGGTLNIGGSLFLGDDGSELVVEGGDVIVSGDINLGATDGLNNSVGASGRTSILMTSGSISCNNLAYSSEKSDTHSVVINGGSFQIAADIRSDGEDVRLTIGGAATVTIGDDLSMSAGNDSLIMNGGILRLEGDWNNQGTSEMNSGTVIFNGEFSQNVTAPNGQEFYNLTIDNSLVGVSLNDSIIINNQLTFSEGKLFGNGNSVTFVDNSSVSGASDDSYIDGPVNKIGNNAFTFPIGSNDEYRPITISAPNTVNDIYRAQYFKQNPNPMYPITNLESGIVVVSELEYWTLDRLVGSSAETVTLSFNSSSLVSNLADLLVCRWDDVTSEWKNEGNGGTTGNSANGTIVSSSTISSFSPFTLGSSTFSNPLPIELLDFEVRREGNSARILWSTQSELNNNFFEIERSFDGKAIHVIGTVASKAKEGNSQNRLDYSFRTPLAEDQSAYYRIKQTDFDGKSKTYDFKLIEQLNRMNQEVGLKIFPNPSNEQSVMIECDHSSDLQFKLYDPNGKEVLAKVSKLSNSTYMLDCSNLPPASYILLCIDKLDGNLVKKKKIIRY